MRAKATALAVLLSAVLHPEWLIGNPSTLATKTDDSLATFVNWETAPVNPIAMSPDGRILAICNLPDARVELFDLSGGTPVPVGSVIVGLDPVSVRFRSEKEAWVVNHISDSVSVVDIAAKRVVATLDTLEGPSDLVFAGTPPRAFVSCARANAVQVFDPATHRVVRMLSIDGERPKAMAASVDGKRIYVALLESGNASTILAPTFGNSFLPAGPSDFPQGPHSGQNPPSNVGARIDPPINPKIPTNSAPPRVSLIVKKNAAGRWMDDNQGDWTEFVSGTNAPLSGRTMGWDMPDHDLAVIDTSDLSVRYASGLMNICMAVSINPASGQVAVVGTEAMNHIRFEPRLQGNFIRVEMALLDPDSFRAAVADLNSHLDYTRPTLPQALRNLSIGDPRGIVWNSAGTRCYVSGMGSDNLLVLDAAGRRLGHSPIPLGEGPTGLALDERRHRLYIWNRFSSTMSIVNTDAETVIETVALFDPTPLAIKKGRKHLYNTHKTSGLGQAACASCHVDARFDRLAWDLGAPNGEMKLLGTNINFARFDRSTNDFHPMKGPMVTQTLQDIIGHEPFHWRGDRDGLEAFNATFKNLQGADRELTSSEMQDFKDFLATIHFPPNRLRRFDNSLPASMELPDQLTLGRNNLPRGKPLPPGNAQAGLVRFLAGGTNGCVSCHTLPSGLGPPLQWTGTRWKTLPPGPNGEQHVALIALERSAELPFKIQQLRSVREKTGASFSQSTSRVGFGLFHDGSVDSLARFVQNGFGFRGDQETADIIAFILCFAGSDLPAGSSTDPERAPGLLSKDSPAAVGRQITLSAPVKVALIGDMIERAKASTGRVDLVVTGPKEGRIRGWLFDSAVGQFQSDRVDESATEDDLIKLAAVGNELTFTLVPKGTGRRIALDRDNDGFFNQDELQTNPADPRSAPVNLPPVIDEIKFQTVVRGEVLNFTVTANDGNFPPDGITFDLLPGSAPEVSIGLRTGVFTWKPAISLAPGNYPFTVLVTDTGSPPASAEQAFSVLLTTEPFEIHVREIQRDERGVKVTWETLPGRTYRVQFKNTLTELDWEDLEDALVAQAERMTTVDEGISAEGERYYRILLER